jgi:uncharacterized protein YggE
MRTTVVIFAFVALSAFAQQPQCDVHSITVTGYGSAKIVPDRVSFTVGVLTTAKSVTEAFNTNNAKTRQVVDALKARGVRDAEIQTSNFSIATSYDARQPTKASGFTVMNSVTVTREDPKLVGDLIAAAVEAGATESNGVYFFNSNPTVARDKAIERAVNDAHAQAARLAAAAGVTLGGVKAIAMADVAVYPRQNQNVAYERITVTASSPTIEIGTNDVAYSATITYELK